MATVPSRGLPAVAIGLLTVLLYAWPVLDGGDPLGAGAVHLGLSLLAGTAAAASCVHAAVTEARRARLAWLLLALGTTVLACMHAVTAGAGTLAGRSALTAAQAGLSVAGIAALLLLMPARPSTGRAARAVDLALTVVGVALLVWVVDAGAATSSLGGDDALALFAAAVLLKVSLLALARARPRGETGLVTLAAGLGLLAVAVAAVVVAQSWGVPALARPSDAGSFAGLLLVGLAAVTVLHPTTVASPGTDLPTDVLPGRAATLALSVPPVVAVVALATGAMAARAIPPVPTALLALAVALSWLRLQLLASDGRASLARLAEDEQRMRHQAFHDPLTGLANRHLFHDRLEHALALHRRSHRPVAVLFGDLDGFKDVNDQHGHDAGDLVLRTVAERMTACLRPTDTLARLGGDEFAVLLEEGEQPDVVVDRLVTSIDEGIGLPSGDARVRMSIGTAVVGPDDPTPTVDELLGRADVAMYAAKRLQRPGTAAVPVGDRLAAEQAEDDGRAALRAALVRDLAAGRMDVVYQPLVDPVTGEVAGVEALARWRFAGLDVPPRAFVELAEQAGLGSALTDLVLSHAAEQLQRWSASLGHDRLTMAVNLTAGELDDASLTRRVARLVERHGLRPGQLVLETTPAALGDGAMARRLLASGAVLSLVSSADTPVALGSLHGVPVSSMKITGAPVGGDDGAAETQVRVLRAVCRELDLTVVVEQVESSEQLAVVRRLGGSLAQGFLLARPAPAGDLDDVVLHGCPVPA